MVRVAFCVFLIVVLTSGHAIAQDESASAYHPMLSDRFSLGIGLFRPSKDFVLRVDGQVPGEAIDFDQELDAKDSETTGSLDLTWHFGEKWSVSGQYWTVNSGARWQLDEDLEWEDLVFKEGTFAEVGVDLDVIRVFFGRQFFTRPGHEFGAGLGLHWLEIDAFIAGQIIVDDLLDTEFRRSSVSAEAPLPNIGAWYIYSWSPKWAFTTRLDWLSASLGDYSGGLANAQSGVHYQLFKYTGIGLSWNYFNLNIDVDKSDWRGKVESSQSGPFLSLDVTF